MCVCNFKKLLICSQFLFSLKISVHFSFLCKKSIMSNALNFLFFIFLNHLQLSMYQGKTNALYDNPKSCSICDQIIKKLKYFSYKIIFNPTIFMIGVTSMTAYNILPSCYHHQMSLLYHTHTLQYSSHPFFLPVFHKFPVYY